ncbi:hypothetical protein [Nocardiopsis tropica]|uniref:Uncharacterized protein n=1 Tax=Nocardiopsis tropica TaxID=109330 RepID=A0ABU7KIA4_9ACTN|nr:hypothetical protein [Nocardiopsis umidischolae]MEE2049024.1 hypothetical protein [Nocardiopsis umidischolae]
MPTTPGPLPAAGHSPPDPLAAVRGRVLLHVKDVRHAPLGHVPAVAGGVVFSGGKARERAKEFIAGTAHACPVVLDPSAYESSYATAEEPFTTEPQHYVDTRRTGLGATLEQWTAAPADLVLSPTRYLRCDDEGEQALAAAVRQMNGTDAPTVVFAVPVDAAWLTERRTHLIAALRNVRAPKALILGARNNPLESRRRASALREVLRSCPDTALLRTDLAALEAMACGAPFTSVGDTSSVRHAVPPGTQGGRPGTDSSPHVILPALMGYFHGSTLAERLRNPRRCLCTPCVEWGESRNNGEAGRALSDFQDSADRKAAHAHNMAVWSRWWRELASETSPGDVRSRWQGMCRRALNEYEWHNREISPREDTFGASAALRYWAGSEDWEPRSSAIR